METSPGERLAAPGGREAARLRADNTSPTPEREEGGSNYCVIIQRCFDTSTLANLIKPIKLFFVSVQKNLQT